MVSLVKVDPIRTDCQPEPPDDILKGAFGSYGKVKGAVAYVAFVGNMSSASVQEKVGYTGEGIILEATSLGLGTCWVGAFFRPDVVAARVGSDKAERVLAVTPLGYALVAIIDWYSRYVLGWELDQSLD